MSNSFFANLSGSGRLNKLAAERQNAADSSSAKFGVKPDAAKPLAYSVPLPNPFGGLTIVAFFPAAFVKVFTCSLLLTKELKDLPLPS